MNTNHHTTLAIDIGGTHCRVAAVRGGGEIVQSVICDTPEAGEPQALAAALREAAAQVRDAVEITGPRAGIGLPGLWDRNTGIMIRAVNLPRLEQCELRGFFREVLEQDVWVATDVVAAGWGQWQTLDPRPERFLYLSLGTGVGGCVILNGEVLRHTNYGPGHFGFLIVDTGPDAPGGANDVPGCLSAMVSGKALERAGSLLPQGAARALAIGLHQLVHIYMPDLIALGGGVIDNHPWLVQEARDAFGRIRGGLTPEHMRIVQAPLLSHDAGVIGVADLAQP